MIEAFEAFVGVNFWTMIFAWCNLLVLYLFLRKLLFKPVKNMIDSRQQEIDGMYAEAEKNRADAAAMKADYEEKLNRANEESEEILKKAVRRAQLREEEILHDANDKAARVMKRAEEQVELEKTGGSQQRQNQRGSHRAGVGKAQPVKVDTPFQMVAAGHYAGHG